MIHNLIVLICSSLVTMSLSVAQSDTWTLAKDEAGVQVYTRKVPGQTLKAFRAVATLSADAQDIIALITNVDQGEAWMDRCLDSRLVKRIDASSYISYTLIDVPWPLQDRDLIVKVQLDQQANQTILEMDNAPEAYPTQDKIVRMPSYEGRWIITPQPDGRTQVISEGISSPGGSIPDWLANSGVVETPYNTMLGLREQVEK